MTLAEHDDPLADKVLMEEEVSDDEVWGVLRRLTLAGKVRPVFSGSALKNWGVQPVLDAIPKIMPDPLQRPPPVAKRADDTTETLTLTPDGPLAGLVFKVQLFDGRRHCFVRLYRGVLTPGSEVRIGTTDKTERVARVFEVDANKKSRLERAEAGQIVLLAGLRHATTGDTLCDPEAPLLLERIDAREPVLGLAVEPRSTADEDKMNEVLRKVCEEDPTLRFEDDAETGQKILKGMGELHLQMVFERLQREFSLPLSVGRPRVVHRETIGSEATATGSVQREIDASGATITLHAEATVRVTPSERGAGITVTAEPTWQPPEFTPRRRSARSGRPGCARRARRRPPRGHPPSSTWP